MDMTSIKQKIFKLFISIFIVILSIGIVFLIFFTFGNYSRGDRAGTIVKLSEKGYVFKTYEGQLNLGMVYVEGSETSVNRTLWNFSVDDNPKLIEKLRQAMLGGNRVRLTYEEKYYRLPWKGETNYIVIDVQMVSK